MDIDDKGAKKQGTGKILNLIFLIGIGILIVWIGISFFTSDDDTSGYDAKMDTARTIKKNNEYGSELSEKVILNEDREKSKNAPAVKPAVVGKVGAPIDINAEFEDEGGTKAPESKNIKNKENKQHNYRKPPQASKNPGSDKGYCDYQCRKAKIAAANASDNKEQRQKGSSTNHRGKSEKQANEKESQIKSLLASQTGFNGALSTLRDTVSKSAKQQQLKENKVQAGKFLTVTDIKQTQQLKSAEKVSSGLAEKVIARIEPGTMMYGHFITGADTDVKSKIIFEIDTGKFRGAKLIGSYTQNNKWAQGLGMEFNKMSWEGRVISVDAMAVNEDNLPLIADEVDNHWFTRIAGLTASSFMAGYGVPYQDNNQPVIQSNGNQQSTFYTPPSAEQAAFSGMSAVGEAFEPVFAEYWNQPTTIRVNAGSASAIMFLDKAEFKENKKAVI